MDDKFVCYGTYEEELVRCSTTCEFRTRCKLDTMTRREETIKNRNKKESHDDSYMEAAV